MICHQHAPVRGRAKRRFRFRFSSRWSNPAGLCQPHNAKNKPKANCTYNNSYIVVFFAQTVIVSPQTSLTIRQLNESFVRGLARGWQLKKRVDQGIIIRELEKEMHMTKRTIMRYINLCYLSPRIVADILEYKKPANLTLRELMNLADRQMDFAEQEKVWSP